MRQRTGAAAWLGLAMALAFSGAQAAEIKVLSAGAMKEVVLSVVPEFEKQSGHKVVVENETAGVLARRIAGGEAFDLVVLTPQAVDQLTASGKLAPGTGTLLARVGVGVVVKAGAPKPDIASVEAFKRALLAAKSVAYIDPASGGSSGIYFDNLLAKLGIAEQVRPKAKLKRGGHVADLIASGEAEIGVHQISEILPVAGVVLVGPLPSDIQNFTTYSGAVGAAARDPAAAKALLDTLAGPAAAPMLKTLGMERPLRRLGFTPLEEPIGPVETRKRPRKAGVLGRTSATTDQAVCAAFQAAAGISLRLRPISASSRSPRCESCCRLSW